MTTKPKQDEPDPKTFAGRRAAREAEGRPANTPYEPRGTVRAGVDAPQPAIVITHR